MDEKKIFILSGFNFLYYLRSPKQSSFDDWIWEFRAEWPERYNQKMK
ncbi:MAG: hypothetical protein JST47_04785 [Bacteroidetes bacterium]|nr:hypothetical protein [Bacteroidota bacterium]MBS1974964.1 hypothetical protein [Bacteroidota bacterium]